MERLEVFYHSVGFNIVKLDSILRTGLMSLEEAKKRDVSYSRSFDGYNLNDTISLVRGIYSNIDTDGAYKKYISNGVTIEISLPLDKIIYDTSERYINHHDEVLCSGFISNESFKSLIIPEEYVDSTLEELPILTLSSTSYHNIKSTSDNIVSYIENTLHGKVLKDEYNELLEELKLTIKALNSSFDDEELNEDFLDIKYELNCFLTECLANALRPYIGKEDITLYDVVSFINSNTLNLPIKIKDYYRGKKR